MTITFGYLEKKVTLAQFDRQILDDLLTPGVVGATDLAVSSTGTALGTSIAAGGVLIAGTDVANQGLYKLFSDAAYPIAHDPASVNPRWDRIIVRMYDSDVVGSGADVGTPEIVKGTENAGAAIGNALGSEAGIGSLAAIQTYYELARVLVPVGASPVIPGGNIRDVRTTAKIGPSGNEPWVIDIDVLPVASTQTNWSTSIPAQASFNRTDIPDTNSFSLSVAHSMNETPTSGVLQITLAANSAVSHLTWDATNFKPAVNGNGGADATGTITLFNRRGPGVKSTGAQNAQIGWDIVLGAGTWTLDLLHNLGSDRGIYTVAIDGVTVGTIDGYNAADTPRQRSQLTGIVVASGGKKRVTLTMATKNASSSSYFGHIAGMRLLRTA